MRRPNREEFYDETTDTYDTEEYDAAMGDYADEQRDIQLEKEWEENEINGTNILRHRKGIKDDTNKQDS